MNRSFSCKNVYFICMFRVRFPNDLIYVIYFVVGLDRFSEALFKFLEAHIKYRLAESIRYVAFYPPQAVVSDKPN